MTTLEDDHADDDDHDDDDHDDDDHDDDDHDDDGRAGVLASVTEHCDSGRMALPPVSITDRRRIPRSKKRHRVRAELSE